MSIGAKLGIGFGILMVVITILIAITPFQNIDTGTVGIVMRLGKIDRVITPGFNYVNPFLENVEIMDTTLQKAEVQADAATFDKQQVITSVAVNFRIDENKVTDIWTNLRNDYVARVINPAIQEAIKQHTTKYSIDELLAKREEVKTKISDSIKTAVSRNDIIVDTVYVTDFRFSEAVNKAIEQTAQAKQEALRAQQELAKVQFEAEQKIASARADAESIRLQSDAANNPRYVELKRIEMMAKFAEKWQGTGSLVPNTMVSGAGGAGGAGFLSILNLTGDAK